MRRREGHPAPGRLGPGRRRKLYILEIGGEFEVGRPVGIKPGTPIDLPLAINIGPLPLPPDDRYVWRLSIDGLSDADWSLAFSTRPEATV